MSGVLNFYDPVVTVRRVGPEWDRYGQRNTCTTKTVWHSALWKIGKRRALVREQSRFTYPRFNGRRWGYRLVRIHAPGSSVEMECVF